MPRAAATPDPERQLMIKTKSCQRLVKEVNYYQKEVKENEAKLATMKEEQRDPYDIKKFEEVLGESYMMIPDSQARMQKSIEDLAQFLQSDEFLQSTSSKNADPSEWESQAREILKLHFTDTGKKATETGRSNMEACEVQETDLQDLKDDEAF